VPRPASRGFFAHKKSPKAATLDFGEWNITPNNSYHTRIITQPRALPTPASARALNPITGEPRIPRGGGCLLLVFRLICVYIHSMAPRFASNFKTRNWPLTESKLTLLNVKNTKNHAKKPKNNEQVKGKSRDGVSESRCAGIYRPWALIWSGLTLTLYVTLLWPCMWPYFDLACDLTLTLHVNLHWPYIWPYNDLQLYLKIKTEYSRLNVNSALDFYCTLPTFNRPFFCCL